MPELPEVRAHAERLTDAHAGATLTAFRALSFTALKTAVPAPDEAHGHTLTRVGQRGKHLLVEIGPLTFVTHLMQGGRLKPDAKRSATPRGGIARWELEPGPALLLTEAGTERRAGVWIIADDPLTQPPLADLGPEADQLTADDVRRRLAEPSGRVHGALRDQRRVAGIGRRLANEICHRAQLSPFAATGRLSDEEIERLVAATHACVTESLAFERGRDEMSASKDRPAAVHHRGGEACPVCGDVVRTVEYRAYEVAYCATCQTGGKVLADNTTSKFLK